MSTYQEKLRDPRWQRMRLEIMQRAGFSCEECGDSTTTLNVHHTYYEKVLAPWEYSAESLRCLCEPCHALVEDLRLKLARAVGGLRIAEQRELLQQLVKEPPSGLTAAIAELFKVRLANRFTASLVAPGLVQILADKSPTLLELTFCRRKITEHLNAIGTFGQIDNIKITLDHIP
jgi:hypothetical protein